MIISIFLDHRKCLTPPNIKPRGGVAETGFRPVFAGFDRVLGGGMSLHAPERTARRC